MDIVIRGATNKMLGYICIAPNQRSTTSNSISQIEGVHTASGYQ